MFHTIAALGLHEWFLAFALGSAHMQLLVEIQDSADRLVEPNSSERQKSCNWVTQLANRSFVGTARKKAVASPSMLWCCHIITTPHPHRQIWGIWRAIELRLQSPALTGGDRKQTPQNLSTYWHVGFVLHNRHLPRQSLSLRSNLDCLQTPWWKKNALHPWLSCS